MGEDRLLTLLQETFGFSTFRVGQREAIETLLSKGRVLCIQPTGHGKSLLYQLPSCLLGGLTLVISPLLALMRDQMIHLKERFNIPAAAINTDQTEEENAQAREDALLGKIQILFIAPEQLDHVDRFSFLTQLDIRLVVVDEAHCISTWGHDFRPSYRQILQFISALTEKNLNLKILGLTATANKKVEEDIKKQLTLFSYEPTVLRESMDRPNISLSVLKKEGLQEKLAACEELLKSATGSGIIYCATRENVELVTEFLLAQNLSVAGFHAGFSPEEKKELQKDFLADRYQALVATNALGMGIDKANIRFVIHFDIPGSITAYYQEVGRAGRDRLPSQGFLLFCPADQKIQQYFIDSAIPTSEDFALALQVIEEAIEPPNLTTIKRLTGLHPTRVTVILAELVEQGFLEKKSKSGVQVYTSLKQTKKPDLSRYEIGQKVKQDELDKIILYAKSFSLCRMAFLRDALGDIHPEPCGHCDVCAPKIFFSSNLVEKANLWLENRSFPITPIALHKVSAGISLLDSKVRSELFVCFMKERLHVSSHEEMDPRLIELLLKQFAKFSEKSPLGGLVPIPSRTWKAQASIIQLLSQKFQLPILELLSWKETPTHRQGELCNNDQRHYNVHQKFEANFTLPIPSSALVLVDDYIGSGNTLKEASRAIRSGKMIKNELIPFTIASLKWHLGKPGFS